MEDIDGILRISCLISRGGTSTSAVSFHHGGLYAPRSFSARKAFFLAPFSQG